MEYIIKNLYIIWTDKIIILQFHENKIYNTKLNMSIISLRKVNKKILYSIFGAIFKLLATSAKDGISKDQEIELKNHAFILGINSGYGYPFQLFLILFL